MKNDEFENNKQNLKKKINEALEKAKKEDNKYLIELLNNIKHFLDNS